jgi:hypothetical protein
MRGKRWIMTQELKDEMLQRLVRKLRLVEPDEEELNLLEDELSDAETEILLELNMDELGEEFCGTLLELAALYYRQDLAQEGGNLSWSYAEGQVSESEKRISPSEFRDCEREILSSLRRYRRVEC